MTTNIIPPTNTNPVPGKPEGNAPEQLWWVYYLSIIDLLPNRTSTGEMELFRERKIETIDDARNVKKFLREEYGFSNPQISFSLLRRVPASQVRRQS